MAVLLPAEHLVERSPKDISDLRIDRNYYLNIIH